MADDVQPTEGQGSDAEGGIFAPYLEAVPAEHRETVAGYLKDAEKNVNERISKASEIEKTLGPYKDVLDPNSYPPDQLQELLAWHQQVTATPEAFQSWLAETAKENGLTAAEKDDIEDDAVQGDLTREEVQKLVEERAQERLGPLEQRLEQWEQQQAIDQTEAEIRDTLSRLESEHSAKLTDEQKAMILDLGMNHEGDDWVDHGFKRFQEITSQGQRAFVADRAGMPGAPMTAGGVAQPQPITDFKDASNMLRERLRNQQS